MATQVPTFIGFPLAVTSGFYTYTFDTTLTSTFNLAFVTASGGTLAGVETALRAGLLDERTYLNIRSSSFPGGEIRSFLNEVPEPSSWLLLTIGLLGLLCYGWRKRQTV